MRTENKDNIDNIDNNDILSAFQQSNKNEVVEVLKELFDKEKIHLIGDLSKDEIKLATRIYMIAEMKNIPIWKKGLEHFMMLLISKDRKSRREILDAIRGSSQQMGFMQKLNPRNWGGRI